MSTKPEHKRRLQPDPLFLDHNPWVHIPDSRDLQGWDAESRREYVHNLRQPTKYTGFMHAFDFLHENGVEGDYFEFGCHQVRTFRMALTEAFRYDMSQMHFYAFDSFAGLPDVGEVIDANEHWQPGGLCVTEADFLATVEQHGIYVDRVRTIKGFYHDTLTPSLIAEFKRRNTMMKFACIDCDLYYSAKPVFAFIEHFLRPGSLIYIDDFFCSHFGHPEAGVARAFNEFVTRSRYGFEPMLQVGWWGRIYVAYDKNSTVTS